MKADIAADGPGLAGHLRLDGIDVANATQGFTVTAAVGNVTRLNLDLVLLQRTAFEGDVEVTVPDKTRAALIHLGWTPPAA